MAIALAVVAVVAVTGVVGFHRAQPPRPAVDPNGQIAPALPDRLFTPSPWLPGTAGAPPMGPLAAVMVSDRNSWTGSSPGLVGVSATTGSYRFLDLPHAQPDLLRDATLSPDGTHLAYWTGSHRGSDTYVDGFAVYDGATGAVSEEPVVTVHGLQVDRGLTWLDDATLVAQFGQRAAMLNASRGAPPLLWRASQTSATPLPQRFSDTTPVGLSGTGLVVFDSTFGQPCRGVDASSGAIRRLPSAVCTAMRGRESPDGRFKTRGNVYVGTLQILSGRQRFDVVTTTHPVRPVPGSTELAYRRLDGAVMWLDDEHLVVERWGRRLGDEAPHYAVDDVVTGTSRPVMTFEGTDLTSVATGLLGRPTRPGVRPPSPSDPRVLAGWAAGAVLVGLGLLLWWRRRRVRL